MQADDHMSMIGFVSCAGGMVGNVQVGDQGDGSLIENRIIHCGLAGRASEGVHLGDGAAI